MGLLPPELLHLIFSYLSPYEARALRLCCKTFADIGACWGFKKISFYLCRADFQKLYRVAHHPIISQNVTLLVYHAANLEEPAKTLSQYREKTKSIVYRYQVEACDENWLPQHVLLNEDPRDCIYYDRDPISPEDIAENYAHYVKAVEEQRRILSTREDFVLLKEVIPRLKQLRTVLVSNDDWHSVPRGCSPFDRFFVYSLLSHEPHGARQTEAVLHGLKGSGVALNSFVAGTLDVSLINRSFFQNIVEACPSLETIDLVFDTIDANAPLLAENTANVIRARDRAETGVIVKFLKAIPSLVEMSIGFTMASESPLRYPANLSHIVADGFKWKQLRCVHLLAIESERQELMRFFDLHKETLRDVELRDCRLNTTSWTRLLREMKDTLTLDDICVTGLVFGRVESEDDYPEGSPTFIADLDIEERWWLGDPDNDPGPCLAKDLTSWFLHDKPYPLTNWQIRVWET
ncbi:hypothetical protein F4809DRAFT_587384 [Biscogniauxia mediterranea]|nr:hypothetical protein F4809DRAFT_587384 [Biscogniauxia mediterranea]